MKVIERVNQVLLFLLYRRSAADPSNYIFTAYNSFPPNRSAARSGRAPAFCSGAENRVVRPYTAVDPEELKSAGMRRDRDEACDPSQTGGCALARDRDFLTKPVALALCSSLRIFTQQNKILGIIIIQPPVTHSLPKDRPLACRFERHEQRSRAKSSA